MRRTTIRRLTIMAGMMLAMAAFASPAWADTFTVDRGDDLFPPNGIGACTAANTNDCTLRGAIQAANTNGQSDTIGFDLGSGPRTITIIEQLTVANDSPADDLTINGPGQDLLAVKPSGDLRMFEMSGTNSINGITISGGRSPNNAGGILNNGGADLTLNDTTVTDNQALGTVASVGYGGGIYNANGATLTLNDTTVSANKAPGSVASVGVVGGGIYNDGGTLRLNDSTVSANEASYGGGIYNYGGTLTLNNSTVSANKEATYGGGIYNYGGTLRLDDSTVSTNEASYGGGIFSLTGLGSTDKTTVTNSTISANTASTHGGGVYNSSGPTKIENSTITNNTAPSGEGSGVASYGDAATRTEILSSIVSANTNTDVDFINGATNSFLSNGFNLIGGGTISAFNKTGDRAGATTPGLDPLADNGGPTQTHALISGSPALDKGTNANCPAADQRGVERPQGTTCDIGAFELEQPNIPPVANNDSYGGKENRTLNVPAQGVLRNDTDANGDALTASVVSRTKKGKLTLSPNGSFAYKPPKNFSGVVSFVYRASDGKGGVDNATVTIKVKAARR